MHANPTEQRLSECGIRPTAQRVQIALLLLAAPQHLSAEQILASLRSAGEIGRASCRERVSYHV